MKKRSLVAIIFLLLSIALGAMAAPGDLCLFSPEEAESLRMYNMQVAVLGDRAYILGNGQLYSWRSGDEGPSLISQDIPAYNYDKPVLEDVEDGFIADYLLSDGTCLYLLCQTTGEIARLRIEEDTVTVEPPVALNWDMMRMDADEGGYMRYVSSISMVPGKLILLVENEANYNVPHLVVYDLATGEAVRYEVDGGISQTPYKNNEVLILRSRYREDDAVAFPELYAMSVETGHMEKVYTFTENWWGSGIYSPEADTYYYLTAGRVMAVESFDHTKLVAYTPIDSIYNGNGLALMPDGLLLCCDWQGAYVRNADPAYLPELTLGVYGYAPMETVTAYTKKYPDIPLLFNHLEGNRTSWSRDYVTKALLSSEKTYDIFQLNVEYDSYITLRDGGFCLDLSRDEKLVKAVDAMYPFIGELVKKNGKLYGIPTDFYGYEGISYVEENWTEAGLSTEHLPTTYLEFLQFVEKWAGGMYLEYPDVSLIEGVGDYRSQLFYDTLEEYLRYCQYSDQPISFDTELFRKLMAALERIDYDAINIPIDRITGYFDEEDSRLYMPALFMGYSDALTLNQRTNGSPLLLPIDKGMDVALAGSVSVMFVNPKSENIALAMDFLNIHIDTMDPYQQTLMMPGKNEPIMNTSYEVNIAWWEAAYGEAQRLLEEAEPENLDTYATMVEEYGKLLEDRDSLRYSVTEEQIQSYREMAEYAFIPTESLYTMTDGKNQSYVEPLIAKYLRGQLSADQFIRELDRVISILAMD